MRFLGVHPGPLMYTKVFLRLEPLGLELVVASARASGQEARLIDLQVDDHRAYHRLVREWRPDVIAFSCNYLANVPEIIDLAAQTKAALPGCFILVGGHSASFTAEAILDHGGGAIDCVLKGEGEAAMPALLAALERGDNTATSVPGIVTASGNGPPPGFVQDLDRLRPARDLLRHRRKYFIGVLDPCASIEFSRGCPWDCSFCSAWTFYGRSYRLRRPEAVLDELAAIEERGIFIVDDVAFVHQEHGLAIGEGIARRGIDKRYYLETRGDVLLRNKDVFRFWRGIGLKYIFLGLEALDEEGLRKYRKRTSLGANFEALEFARSLGIDVAINIIADPDWDEHRFAAVREWCLDVPEVVNLSVNTPYPGTETWHTESRRLTSRDYRLFDIQHCVLPTRLPLDRFYEELVTTQRVLAKKHLSWRTLGEAGRITAKLLLRGQANFAKSLFKFNSVYNPALLLADHRLPVTYEMPPPPPPRAKVDHDRLFIHRHRAQVPRALDPSTQRFVNETANAPQ